ncbi:unnamed protein product [Durusdinium trenchii]|uniref:Uncharacterized protein n=1 Tax=Durusdinium trenchii TaxID=1381693 RepID=A0ABP0NWC1_9DINO
MVESPPRHVPIFLNARRVLWRNAARALCAVAAVQGVTLVGRFHAPPRIPRRCRPQNPATMSQLEQSIYTAELEESLAERLAEWCLHLEEQEVGRFVSNCGGWQSRDLVARCGSRRGLRELLEKLSWHLSAWQAKIEGATTSIAPTHAVADQLWANINRPGHFNRRHDHGTATASLLVSGVFYCQCTPEAPLRLYGKEVMEIHPKPGFLILFPPDMEHEVDPVPPNGRERISIAFNLRARWLQEPWQRHAIDGTLEVDRMRDVDAADAKLGLTALHLAAEAGHLGLIQQLLDASAVPHLSREGWSPLGLAAERGHHRVVEFLLDHSNEPQNLTAAAAEHVQQTGVAGPQALAAAAARGHRATLAQLLRCFSAEDDAVARAAAAAAGAGQVEILEDLLPRTSPDVSGQRSLLHEAAGAGHVEVCRILLSDASLLALDEHGATALHEASAKGHAQVVDLLLERKAPLHLQDCEALTPLHWAARKGHVSVAQLLLAAGAHVEKPQPCPGATHTAGGSLLLRSGPFWSRARFAESAGSGDWSVFSLPKKERTALFYIVPRNYKLKLSIYIYIYMYGQKEFLL